MTLGRKGQLIPFPGVNQTPSAVERAEPTAVEPAPGKAVEPAPLVVNGEIVDDPRPLAQLRRVVATRIDQQRPGNARATLPAPVRLVARAAYTTAHGHLSWARRAMNALTHAHLREQVRMARLTGDREALAEWTDRLTQARDSRHSRLQNLPKTILGVLWALGMLLLAFLGFLVIAGAWVTLVGVSSWSGWWSGLYALAHDATAAGGVLTRVLLWGAFPALLIAAWREGKRVGDLPRWLISADERVILGAEITPSKVVVALRDLGITALRNAIKEAQDAGGGLLGPIAIAGCGVEVDVRLPSGTSTDQIQGRRRRLAENLDRHEHELFITVAAARTVRLWVANPGALDEPIGPSPLVTDPTIKANMRTGKAPWGQSLRGDRVTISLWQRHVLVTGLSNQGKTKTGRALVLWLALDVRVEFRLADLKGFGDWDMFTELATVYIKGPADEHVIAATEMLEEGVAEMKRRLVSGRDDWDPLVLIVDEAQVAYMCPAVGPDKRPYGGKKNTSRFFMAVREIENQGRAVNVLVWQFTQDPTDQNLPKLVREAAHVRASLVVGTEEQARMALGDKAVDGGAAPHLLRQGLDKGTVVVAGDGVDLPAGEASITVRTHFVDDEQAWEVARRAVERRRKAGKLTQVIDATATVVDPLTDIHVAMRGEKRVRTVVVLGRLIEDVNPSVYEPWGHEDLASAVRKYTHLGLDIRKYGGDSVLRLEEVERALERRE